MSKQTFSEKIIDIFTTYEHWKTPLQNFSSYVISYGIINFVINVIWKKSMTTKNFLSLSLSQITSPLFISAIIVAILATLFLSLRQNKNKNA